MITVIIAAKNEERNIGRCLDSVQFCDQIMVVDSHSTDTTASIAQSKGADVHQYDYTGGWPKKRQWAMENLDIKNPWTLLLDADEVVSEKLRQELSNLCTMPNALDGYWITLRMFFLGRELKHGATGLKKLSFFRTGKGRYEKRLENQDASMADMEVHEHVIVDGTEGICTHPIIHHNVNTLDRYIQKHNEYSNWESALMCKTYSRSAHSQHERTPTLFGNQSQRKRWIKHAALRLPGFAALVFLYYYIVRMGFCDGKPGFIYCMFQAIQYFHIKAKMFEKAVTRNS